MVDTAPSTTAKQGHAPERSAETAPPKPARTAASRTARADDHDLNALSVGNGTTAPHVDVAALGRQLLGTWPDIRLAARERAARPDLQRIEGQPMAEHRERVLQQMKILVETQAVHRAFPKELGGADDHGGNIAAFEELVLADPSLQIKAGVQWG